MTMTIEPTAVDLAPSDGAASRVLAGLPIVGRESEIAALDEAMGRLLRGQGQVIALIGEAGIGKTTLLDAFLLRAADGGVPAWHTMGRQLEQARPLGPLLELLSGIGPDGTIEHVIDPLRDTTVRMSTDNGVEFALVELLVDRLEADAGTGPFVVVLDDAHWADAATVRCLRLLGTRLVTSGACLVVACRPLPPGHLLSRQLDDLAPITTTLRVGPLPTAAARRLVERAVPRATGSKAVDDIVASAGGNPLLLEALSVRGSSDGGRDPIVAAVASLSEPTLSILRHAAVASVTIDIDLLRELLPVRPAAILEALAEAELAGVVTRIPRWRFAHDLFHETLYGSLDESTRRALHLETAVVLRRTGRPAVDIAEQYRRGALPGNREAIEALHLAASEVAAVAPSAALALFDAAIELCGPAGASIELLADHLRALAWTGDLDAADAVGELLIGRDLAPDVAYRVRHELAFTTFVRGQVAETLEHLRHAAMHAPTASLAARTESERALASLTSADEAGAAAFAVEGLRLGRLSGDAPAVGLASAVLSLIALYHLDLPTARVHADAVERLASGPMGRDVSIYQPLVFAALVAFEADDEAGTNDLLRRAREDAAETGTVWAVPMYDAIAAYQALRRGRLDDARASAMGGSALAEAADAFAGGAWCDGLQAQVEILMGNTDLAEQLVARAEAEYASPQAKFGPEQAALARSWLLERSGDQAAAFEHLRSSWEFIRALGLGSSSLSLVGDLARYAFVARDASLAIELSENVDMFADRTRMISHDATRMRVHAWRDGDVDLLERAVDRFLEAGYLTAAAMTGVDQARLARQRGDHAGERRALQRAAELFQSMGADAEADRILGSTPRTKSRRPRYGWNALTATEQRVVALVAAGRSNPEIATELYVSRRTVESHVAAALRKMEVRSRTALAARSHQRGLDGRAVGPEDR